MTRNLAGRGVALQLAPLWLCLAAAAAAGCNTTVEATNPYDPDSLDPAPSSVSGRVRAAGLDAATPIPVLLRSLRDPAEATERVTDAGSGDERSFRFDVVHPGSYSLELSVLGFDPVTRLVEVQIGEDVDVGLVELVAQDGERGGALHGVVGLEGRAPGDSADVVVTLDDGAESRLTDGSGSFRMEGVRPGSHRLQFRHPDFLSPDAPLEVEVTAGGDSDVNVDPDGSAHPILLQPNPGSIQGSVVLEDPSGAFVAAAGIDVGVEGGTDSVVTDDTGSFSLPGVIPGDHVVVASFAGHLPARVAVSVRGGQAVALAEPLSLRYRKGALHGTARLTDRNAGEFDLLTVELRGPDALALSVLPRVSGELRSGGFGFTGLPVGSYHVVARHDSYGIGEADVLVVEGEDVEVPELELTRLEGDFAIDDGAPYTNEPAGHVRLGFDLPPNAAELRVSQDEALFAGDLEWEPVPAPGADYLFTLQLLDGEQTVFAQLKDTDGSVGRVLRSSIVRDTQGPAPSATPAAIVVGAGTGFASESDGTLTLSLSALDPPRNDGALVASGVGRVEVWIDEAALPDPGNLASAQYVTSPLVIQRVAPSPLVDGERLVHAIFYDRANNPSSEVVQPVILDRVLPAGSIRIVPSDAADSYVRSTRVEVEITATDTNLPLEIRLSNSQSFGQLAFGPADPVIEHSLSFGDGPKTVYAELRDAAGNVTGNLFDQIQLDTVGPVAQGLLLAGGAIAVASPTVQVGALGSGASTMELSVISPSGAVQALTVPFPSSTVTLASEEGEHRVTAVLVDAAGNRSTSVTDTVRLDTTAPGAPSVAISEGADVRSATVTLLLFAQAATGMKVATDGTVDTEPVQPYATSLAVTLAGADGAKTVEVLFVDDAGNASAPVQATTTLDRSAPVAGATPILAVIPPPFTAANTTAVNLLFSATGADELRYAAAATPSGAAWAPYSATGLVLLPAPDGTKSLSVEFRDRAGNTIGPFTTQLDLDTTPPQAQGLILAGGATAVSQLLVDVTAIGSGATSMELSVVAPSGAVQSLTVPFPTTQVTLAAEEGDHRITLTLLDDAGNSTAALSQTIAYDVTAPASASISILQGAVVRSAAIDLSLFALDATRMRVAIDGTVDTEPLQPYATSLPVTLAGGEGAKSVAVIFVDAAGNASAQVTAATTLDTTAPVPGGSPIVALLPAPFTSSRQTAVNLQLSAAGATEMRVAPAAAPTSAPWVPYSTSTVVFLPAIDAAYTVSVEFRDLAGNTAGPFTTSVTLDTVPPTSPQVTLAGQTPYATTRSLTPSLLATGASFMKVGFEASLSSATLLPYAAGAYAGLPALAADGAATVYAQFLDAAGNATGILSVATTVDTLAPENPQLRLVSTSPVSSLSVQVEPFALGAAEMSFVIDGTAGAYQAYSSAASVTLPATQGAHTIAVQFRDAAGNVTAVASRPSVSVTLDTVGPVPGATPLAVVYEAPFTAVRTSTVNLAFSATGADELRFAAGATPSGEAWVSYSTSGVLLLPAPDGAKTVSVEFRDLAGNVAGPYTASVTLDTVAPTGPAITLPTQAPYSTSRTLRPTLAATGASFMKVSYDPGFAGASMLTYTAGIYNGLAALPADGAATVYAQYWDAAGNPTPVVAASTTVDTLAPQSEALVLVTRSPASADSVTVAPFAVGASQLRFFVDGVAGALQPYATSLSVSLPLVDGAHTIAVEFQDAAGNATPAASRPSVSVIRDTVAPQSPSVTVRGFIGYGCDAPNAPACAGPGNPDTLDYTRLDVLAVTLGVTGAVSFAFGAGVLDCDTATYLVDSFPAVRVLGNLGLAEGSNTVTACFKDAAGNVSFDTSTITLDTTPPSAARVASLTAGQGLVSWSWQPSSSTETGLVYRAIENGIAGGASFHQDTAVAGSGTRVVAADNCTDVSVAIGVADRAGNFSISPPSTVAPRFNPPAAVDLVGWHRNVAVTWAAVAGADHYEVDLTDASSSSTVITARASAAGATSLRLVTPDFSTALADGHSYQARVVATDATGACDGASTTSGTDSTLLPTSSQERFGGFQLAGGADFDHDGHEDWATLSASRSVNVISGRTGEVLLTRGPQGRSVGTGIQQAFIGDLDNDGAPDFLVGDPLIGFADPPNVTAISSRTGAVLWTVSGVASEQLGAALVALPDVTGDGIPDVLAGAPAAAGGGRVVVINGATGLIVGTPATGAGLAGGTLRFGAALSTTSFPAASCGIATSCQVVLVGAPGATSAGGLAGAGAALAFRVVPGAAPSFVSLAPTRLWYGSEANAELGTAVTFFLDGNLDGTHDVALGAPGALGRAGRVELRSGASGASIAVYTDPASAGSARLGSSLAASIDLDGDGGGELLAGAPGQSGTCPIGPTTTAAGRAILISGSRGDALWSKDGDPCDFGTQASALGTSVAFADVDADGAPDYILGAPGADKAFIHDNGVTYVYDGHDLGLFPSGLRAFKFFEYPLDGVDGTPPYVFSGVQLLSGGNVTPDGSYRSGNTVAVADRVRVTDAKGRTRTISIPVYDFGQTTTITPPTSSGSMRVAVVGDMTGPGGVVDGVPEVAVSDMGAFCGAFANCGHVYVYNGATGVLYLDLSPGFSNAGFGAAILGLPDLTGDGKAELVVSGIYPIGGSDGSAANGGQLRLFNGATGAQLGTRVNGGASEEAGYVLVGAPSAGVPGRFLASAPGRASGAGGIYVCDASGVGLSCVLGYAPAGAGAELGRSLAVGDVSGDSVPEVIAGAPSPGNLGGRVEVLALDAVTGALSLRLSTTATGGADRFGSAVAIGSDYDLDGKPDLVVGASQRMAFFGPGDVVGVSSSSGIELGSAGNVPAGGRALRSSDVDWDGRIDLYSLSATRELFLISGQSLQTYGRISTTEDSFDIGDLDLDGVPDVVGANDAGQLHIFRSRIP